VQKTIGASRVAMTLYLGPLYASVMAWIVLGEGIGLHHVIGGVLILTGVGLVMSKQHDTD
jgi:drug/metabolite transporter (DMT)-like permease